MDGNIVEYLNMIFENRMIARLVASLAIMVVGLISLYIIKQVLNRIRAAPGVDERSIENLYKLIKSALFIILVFLILYTLTQQQVIVYFIIGTVLIMFAASWEVIANAAAYYVILVSRRFGKGDYVEIDGVTGKIDEITPFYTVVRADDGVHNIPNLKLLRTGLKLLNESVYVRINVRLWGIDDPEVADDIMRRIEEVIALQSKSLVTAPRHMRVSAILDEVSSDSVSLHINLPVPGPKPNRKRFNRLIRDLAVQLKETGYSFSITISEGREQGLHR